MRTCSPHCLHTHLSRSPEQSRGIYCQTFVVQKKLTPTFCPATTTPSQVFHRELQISSSPFLRIFRATHTPHPHSAVRTCRRMLSWQHLEEAMFFRQLLAWMTGVYRHPLASPLLKWLAYVPWLWFLASLGTKYQKMVPVRNCSESVWIPVQDFSNIITFHNQTLRYRLSSAGRIHFLDEDKRGKWIRRPQRSLQWQENHLYH